MYKVGWWRHCGLRLCIERRLCDPMPARPPRARPRRTGNRHEHSPSRQRTAARNRAASIHTARCWQRVRQRSRAAHRRIRFSRVSPPAHVADAHDGYAHTRFRAVLCAAWIGPRAFVRPCSVTDSGQARLGAPARTRCTRVSQPESSGLAAKRDRRSGSGRASSGAPSSLRLFWCDAGRAARAGKRRYAPGVRTKSASLRAVRVSIQCRAVEPVIGANGTVACICRSGSGRGSPL